MKFLKLGSIVCRTVTILFILRGTAKATDGMMVYYTGSSPQIPIYKTWDGNAWSGINTVKDVGAGANYWYALRESSLRDEKILGIRDSLGHLNVMVLNGSSWSEPQEFAQNTSYLDRRSFDIAYEKNSGKAICVYRPGGAGAYVSNTKYRVWDGASWSSEYTVSLSTFNAAAGSVWIQLQQNPKTNEIMLVIADELKSLTVCPWDGSGWGEAKLISANLQSIVRKTFDIAYEQVSGQCLIGWVDDFVTDQRPRYIKYDGVWSSSAPASSHGASGMEWLRMVSKPNSNELMLATLENVSGRSDINAEIWNGTSWGNASEVIGLTPGGSAPGYTKRYFDIAYESQSGDGIIVYSDNSGTPQYNTWNGAAWSTPRATATAITDGDIVHWVKLASDPYSDKLFLMVSDATNDLNFQEWSGSTWGAITEIDNNSSNTLENFDISYKLYVPDTTSPSGISNLTVLAGSAEGTVFLRWTAPGDDGTTGACASYYVNYSTIAANFVNEVTIANYYSVYNSTYSPVPAWFPLTGGSEEGINASRVVSGLTSGVTYYFGIRASDGTNFSAWQATSTANAASFGPAQNLPPGTPDNFLVQTYDSARIRLMWSQNSESDFGFYNVQRATSQEGAFTTVLSTPALTYTIHLDTGPLITGTTYWYRIRALDIGGNYSVWSSTKSAYPTPVAPIAPAGMSGVAVSTGAILWTWGDTNEDNFRIKSDTNGILADNLAQNLTFWFEQNLTANTSYQRYVEAYNGVGLSSSAPSGPVYTLSFMPANLTISGRSENTVSLSWNANGNTNAKYGVSFSSDNFQLVITTTVDYSKELTAETTTVYNLTSGTTYTFRCWAYNGDGLATNYITSPATVTLVSNQGPMLVINEIAPAITGADWLEIYVNQGGDYSNYKLYEGQSIVHTFPGTFNPSAGDYIIIHFNDAVTPNEDDVSGNGGGGNDYWDFYSADAGLTATDNIISIRNVAGTTWIDGMGFSDKNGSLSATNRTAYTNIKSAGMWVEGPVTADGTNDVAVENALASWPYGSSSVNSVARMPNAQDNNSVYDWFPTTATTQGNANPNPPDIIPPGAISDLTALTGSGLEGTIKLRWTAPGDDNAGNGNATAYLVRYSSNYIGTNDFYASWVSTYSQTWTPVAFGTAEGAAGNLVASGLIPGVTYWFAIKAKDDNDNWGSWTSSGTQNVNTLNWAVSFDTSPAVPGGLNAVASDSSTITVTWSQNSEADFQQYNLEASSWSADVFSILIATGPVTNLSYAHSGLDLGNTYYYRIKSNDLAGNYSAYSSTKSAYPVSITLVAPANMLGVAVSTASIMWTWNDNSNNETGFRVKSSTEGIMKNNLSINATYWLEQALTPGTSYQRYVEAYNGPLTATSSLSVAVWTLDVTPNLLENNNPGFELDFQDWTKDGTDGSIKSDAIVFHSGGKSCLFDALTSAYEGGRGVISSTATINSGQRYVGGAWFFAPFVAGAITDTQIRFQFYWYDAAGVVISTSSSADLNLSAFGIWEWLYLLADSPGNAETARLAIHSREPDVNNNSDVYVDDTMITYDLEAPAAISDLIVSPHPTIDGALTMSWTAPGDDEMSHDLSGGLYSIKAATFNITGANFDSVINNPYYTYSVSVSTSYNTQGSIHKAVISGLYSGTTYYFAVKIRDDAGNWSGWSTTGVNDQRFAPAQDLPPSVVLNLAAEQELNAVSLYWTEPAGDDIDYYKFYRDSSPPYDFADAGSPFTIPRGQASFHDGSLETGGTYYYRAETFDRGNGGNGLFSIAKSSAYSNIASTVTLVLGYAASDQTGNEFVIDSNITVPLRQAGEKLSYRFIAQKSGLLDKIRLYIGDNGSGVTYFVNLETDSDGYPSGIISGATFAIGTLSGWTALDLPDINLTQGTTYHIVIAYSEGLIGSSNYAYLYYTFPLNEKWINGLTSNGYRTTLYYNGGWSNRNAEPVYILEYKDGSFEGRSWDWMYSSSMELIFSQQYTGERFTFTGEKKANAVKAYVKKNGSPADHLYYRLETAGSVLVSSGIFVSSTTAVPEFSWKTAVIGAKQTLPPDTYRLYFFSPLADENNYYVVNHPESHSSGGPYNTLTYDGTNSVFTYSSDGGMTWQTRDIEDLAYLLSLDEIPPAAINDLSASIGSYYGTVRLSWLFPGDDGWNGNIKDGSYEVRYSTVQADLSTGNYSSIAVSTSSAPNERYSYLVGGLLPGGTYYFQVFAKDEQGNISSAGNTVFQPAQGQQVYNISGNKFAVTGTSTISLDAANKKASFRFKAQMGGQLKTIRIYHTQSGPGVSFIIGIYSNNNGIPGVPAANGYGVFFSSDTSGWKTINLISQCPIILGETYHLVTEYQAQIDPYVIDATHKTSVKMTTPFNEKWVNNIETNSTRNTLYYNGASWTEQNKEPVYILEYQDGNVEGNPYNSYSDVSISGSNWHGQEFFNIASRQINGVDFYVKMKGTPIDDLYYKLQDVDGPQDLAGGKAAARAFFQNDSLVWITVPFGSKKTLAAGHTYRLALYSPAPAPDTFNCFNVNEPNSDKGLPYSLMTFDSNNAYYTKSADGGVSWSDDDSGDIVYSLHYDPLSPDAVDDFSAVPGPSLGSISLRWTAPADDAEDTDSGKVTRYEIRYATCIFSSDQWAAAYVNAGQSPLPTIYSPGVVQEMIVTGLISGNTYFFRIKSEDEMLNYAIDATVPQAQNYAQPYQLLDHIVISEFSPYGASSADEFVEIYNPTDFGIDISGYQLRYATTTTALSESGWTVLATVPAGTLLPGRRFYLFTHNTSFKHSVTADKTYDYNSWTDGGHWCIFISSRVIDKAGWGSAATKAEGVPVSTFTVHNGVFIATMSWQNGGSYERGPGNPGGATADTDNNSVDFRFKTRRQPANTKSPKEPDTIWPAAINPARENLSYQFTPRNAALQSSPKEKLLSLIGGAQSHVYVAIYTLTDEDIISALNSKAEEGKLVRLIVDSYTLQTKPGIGDLLSSAIKWRQEEQAEEMHDKFVVIDGNTVYTGSVNFTISGFRPQDNNSLVIVSTQAAKNYENEFAEMWWGYFKKYKQSAALHEFTVGGVQIENYFSPQDDVVDTVMYNLLSEAKESILFAGYTFSGRLGDSSAGIEDRIYDKYNSGITVKGIFDRSQYVSGANTAYKNETFNGMDDKGLAVRLKSGVNNALMHNKLIILDQEIVVTGSANFTDSASQSNDENIVVLRDKKIARQYVRYFADLWKNLADEDTQDSQPPDNSPPEAISGVRAYSAGSGAIAVEWTESTAGDFSKYYVFISTEGPITQSSLADSVDNNGNGLVDEGAGDGNLMPEKVITNKAGRGIVLKTAAEQPLVNGVNCYVAVLCCDRAGNESYSALYSTAAFTPAGGTDSIVPSPVTDLEAFPGVNFGEVDLSWTATGDDAWQGIASEYDIRWSVNVISEANFNTAQKALDAPSPLPSGVREIFTIKNFYPGTTYYFALKVKDEAPNSSLISNPGQSRAQSLPVIINEFIYNPVGTDSGQEWIELFNNSSTSIKLDGWTVERAASNTWEDPYLLFTIRSSTAIIPGKGYFLCAQQSSFIRLEADFAWDDSKGLNNTSNTGLRIKDHLGNVIDYIGYNLNGALAEGGAAPSDIADGASLTRFPDGNDTNNNRSDFIENLKPTPTNSFGPDMLPPDRILNLSALSGDKPGEIKLSWSAPGDNNGTRDNNAEAGYIVKFASIPADLSGDPARWWDGAKMYAQGWEVSGRNTVESQVLHLIPGATYYFGVKTVDGSYNHNISSIDFRSEPGGELQASAKALEGDAGSRVRINEVAPDQSSSADWIELYNPNYFSVDINGWSVYKVGGDSVTKIDSFETATWTFPATSYLVLNFTDARQMSVPQKTGSYWELFTSKSDHPNPGPSEDGIVLIDSTGGWIDGMFYSPRDGSLTSAMRSAYNFALSTGQWYGPEATGSNDSEIDKNLANVLYAPSSGWSVARNEVSLDGTSPSNAEWFMSKTLTKGAVNANLDKTAPAQINNLSVSQGKLRGSLILKWTARGDDVQTGTASGYLVKYSGQNIENEEQFEQNAYPLETAVKNSQSDTEYWTPLVSGVTEEYYVAGLTPGPTYYFSIKSEDERPNTSPMSNVVSGVALDIVGSYLRISEVAPMETGGDWIELYCTENGVNLAGWKLYSLSQTIPVKTFSSVVLSSGDYLVVNLSTLTVQPADETADRGANGYWDVYAKYDLDGSQGVLLLKDKSGNIEDFVAYSKGTAPSWDSVWANAVKYNQWAPWTPAVSNAVNISGGVSGFSLGRGGAVVDTDNIGNSKNDWELILNPTKGSANEFAAPDAVSDLVATGGNTDGAINLSWTAVGDDWMIGKASLYDLRYSTAGEISSAGFSSASIYSPAALWLPKTGRENEGSNNERVVSGLTLGLTYYFALKAADETGKWGVWYSSAESGVNQRAWAVASDTAPLVPQGFRVSGTGNQSVSLAWNQNTEPDLDGYVLEFSSGNNFYTQFAPASAATVSYNHTGLTNSVTYFYRMKSFDLAGHYSGYSVTVSTIPTIRAPSLLTGSFISANGISLSWAASTDSATLNFSGYRVYRSTLSVSGPWTVTAGLISSTTHYDTQGIAPEVIYYYQVTALDLNGSESDPSNAASVTSDNQPPRILSNRTPQTVGVVGEKIVFELVLQDVSGSVYASGMKGAYISMTDIGGTVFKSTEPMLLRSSAVVSGESGQYVEYVYRYELAASSVTTPGVLQYIIYAYDANNNALVTSPLAITINKETSALITASGGTVEVVDGNPEDGRTSIIIPPGAMKNNETLTIVQLRPGIDDIPQAVSETTINRTVLSTGMPVAIFDFKPDNTAFNKPVTITIKYLNLDGNDYVDGTSINENDLRIYFWSGARWEYLGGTVYPHTEADGAKRNTVSIKTVHFTKYALFPKSGAAGEIAPTKFITPASPGFNDYAVFGQADLIDKITIFDIKGVIVRELNVAADGNQWDGRNDSGNIAESGLYIYRVKSIDGSIKYGKIVVAK